MFFKTSAGDSHVQTWLKKKNNIAKRSYLVSKLTCIFQFNFSGPRTTEVIFQMTYFSSWNFFFNEAGKRGAAVGFECGDLPQQDPSVFISEPIRLPAVMFENP